MPTAIYRAPMRARELEAPPFAGARFGIENGLVGIGERVEPVPVSPAEAAEILAVTLGPKAGRMLERFAGLPDGTPVWTQTDAGRFRLGRIAGPWRYEDSKAARAVGIHQVRDAVWMPDTLEADRVPAAVVATFDRGGRNLQRIHDERAESLSAGLLASA